MKLKIGVFFGGQSLEHELSILTAIQAMDQIDKEKYEIIPIYIGKDLTFYSGGMLRHIDSYKDFRLIEKYAKRINVVNKKGRFILQTTGLFKHEFNEIHLAFPMSHGKNAEDGVIQGFLELLGIPYVGSDIYASVVCQDKVYMKQILQNNGLPLINYVWLTANDYSSNKEELFKKMEELNYPLIIKPARLGSSIGIGIVNRKEELESSIEKSLRHDDKIIIEELIENQSEFNIAILGSKGKLIPSVIEEIKKDGICDYLDKYTKDNDENTSFKRIYPATISKNLNDEIEKLALRTYTLLSTKGCARVDFLYDNKKKKLYINEINSIPNFFSYYLFEDKNIDYRELLTIMIKEAIENIHKKENIIQTLDTDILKTLTSKDVRELK